MPSEGEKFLGISSVGGNGSSQSNNSSHYGGSNTPVKTSSRYPALQFISVIHWIFAVALGVIAIVCLTFGAILIEKSTRMTSDIILALGGGIVCLMGSVMCMAMAEGIKLFIDIEENTRKQSMR